MGLKSVRTSRWGILVIGLLTISGALLAIALGFGSPISTARPISADPTEGLPEARQVFLDGDLPRAETLLRRLSADDPTSVELKILRGRVQNLRGRLVEAKEIFSSILKSSPRNLEATRGLAESYFGLGQFDLSISLWSRATEIEPANAALWKGLGLAQREKGDLWGALASFQESLERDPGQEDLSRLAGETATRAAGANPATPPGGLPGAPAPGGPRAVDPATLVPRPSAPDPSRHFPKPGGLR